MKVFEEYSWQPINNNLCNATQNSRQFFFVLARREARVSSSAKCYGDNLNYAILFFIQPVRARLCLPPARHHSTRSRRRRISESKEIVQCIASKCQIESRICCPPVVAGDFCKFICHARQVIQFRLQVVLSSFPPLYHLFQWMIKMKRKKKNSPTCLIHFCSVPILCDTRQVTELFSSSLNHCLLSLSSSLACQRKAAL